MTGRLVIGVMNALGAKKKGRKSCATNVHFAGSESLQVTNDS